MTTNQEQIIAGQAATVAMQHLAPAFDAVEGEYARRLAEIATAEPWATDKIKALAFALKVSQGVRAHIEAIVAGGDIAQANDAHMKKIAAMSPERRRILGL